MHKRDFLQMSAFAGMSLLCGGALEAVGNSLTLAASQDADGIDARWLQRIRAEAAARSTIIENASTLTEVYGARLTGSPAFNGAADWARLRLASLPGVTARLDSFPWGAGWSYSHFEARMLRPQPSEIEALPMPYSAGTDGVVRGEVVLTASAGLDRLDDRTFDLLTAEMRGRVRGKFVMLKPPLAPATPPALPGRLTDTDLAELEREPPATPPPAASAPAMTTRNPGEQLVEFFEFLRREGAAGVLWRSGRLGAVSTTTLSMTYRDKPAPLPVIFVATEHYNRIGRLAQRGTSPSIELNLTVSRTATAVNGVNVIAEIPGTRKPNEVVMIGAHLDSWIGGTGATDNAAGCAVVMEVARILAALALKLDRTVRVALWGGEEGAGLGARTYVEQHYGTTVTPTAEHAAFSAYFNIDNGTGKVRGVYTSGNRNATPVLQRWFASLADPDVRTVSLLTPTGILSSDDGAVADAGLPALAFIQDPVNYRLTHHSTLDTFDRLAPDDLQQAAVIAAALVSAAASRDRPVPRAGRRNGGDTGP
jgi:hypothetical protein